MKKKVKNQILTFLEENEDPLSEEEPSSEEMDIQELHFIEKNEVIVAVSVDCRAIVITEVFSKKKRKCYKFTFPHTEYINFINNDLNNNILFTKNRNARDISKINQLYFEFNWKDKKVNTVVVKNYIEYCNKGLSLSLYDIIDVSDIFNKEVYFFLMDDEIALFDVKKKEFFKSEIYSAVNYYDFVYVDHLNQEEEVYVYQSEDRSGLIFMAFSKIKKKMKFLKKFNSHGFHLIYSGTHNTIHQVEKIGDFYFIVMKINIIFHTIFKFNKTFDCVGCLEFQNIKDNIKPNLVTHFEGQKKSESIHENLQLFLENNIKVNLFDIQKGNRENLILKIICDSMNSQFLVFIVMDQNLITNSTKIYQFEGNKYNFIITDEKYFIKFKKEEILFYLYKELIEGNLSQFKKIITVNLFHVYTDKSNIFSLSISTNEEEFFINIYGKEALNLKNILKFVLKKEGNEISKDFNPKEIKHLKLIKERFLLIGYDMEYILFDCKKKTFEWIGKHRLISESQGMKYWKYFNFLKFGHSKLYYLDFEQFLDSKI